jgi:predicted dehydrogenase
MAARILQVGCGRWGKNVLRDLVELGASVTVLARSGATAERARAGGAAMVVSTVEEAGPVDGAVVVTPAPHHAEAVEGLAPLGVPIFCEKPLVTDPADGRRLLELCGERLFVMHKWRWHPGIEALARLASDGTLGEPAGVRSHRLGWGPFHFRVDSVDTLAPHDLSIAIAVLGELPPVAVARGSRYPGLEGGWADCSALLVRDGGPYVELACSSVSAHRLRRVEVVGSAGSATLGDPEAPEVEVLVHGGDLDRPPERDAVPLEREWPLLRELRDFVAHCEGGPPPRAGAAEGVAVVQAIAELRAALG